MAQAQHVAARSVGFHLGPVPLDQLTPRRVEPEDWLRFDQSMAEIFAAFGSSSRAAHRQERRRR